MYRNLETLAAAGLVRAPPRRPRPGPLRADRPRADGWVDVRALRRASTRSTAAAPPACARPSARRPASRPRFGHFPLVGLCRGCTEDAAMSARMRRARAALTPGGVAARRRPGRRRRGAARDRLLRPAGARRAPGAQPRRGRRLLGRRRADRLHARAPPRVRRRPHRGDRQHDAQAHGRRQPAAQRRLLLRARALHRRARARGAARRRRARARRRRRRTTARPCSRRRA